MIDKKPFVRYDLDNKYKEAPISVKLNKEERDLLNQCKLVIEQSKDSTALKTLAWIGAKVLLEEKTSYILATLFKNKRNNQRMGVVDFE